MNVANLSVTALNFGNQTINTTSGPRTETLTNFGTTPIAITSIVATGPFTQTNTCGASLAVAATCAIVIKFSPTTLGPQTGAVTITDSAPGSPRAINLSGNGINAPPTTCPANPAIAQLRQNYGNLPLTFEANLGQTDAPVKFLARGRGYGLFLTPTQAVLSLEKSSVVSRQLQRTKDHGPRTTDHGQRTPSCRCNCSTLTLTRK